MGALTLKSFPFKVRGWDVEKFKSIDPTDGFGSNTRVYISKNQIVQIEPSYNIHTFNTWLTDKGRQFFDGIFGIWSLKDQKTISLEKNSWANAIKTLIQTVYVFDHCNNQQSKNQFFTIIFENLSIEILSILLLLSQNYSFINLKRCENFKSNNDLEADFQLNLGTDEIKLKTSTLCLLVANNPRYEGYYLNLNLRQRFLKGNFKCLTIGSLINLTFPISFIGSNLKVLKTIVEGNNTICQDLNFSENPFLIINSELSKRNNNNEISKMLKIFKYSNIFSSSWNGLNTLTPALSETGTQSIAKFLPFNSKDITNFSTLYLVNTSLTNITNLKQITESYIINYSFNTAKKLATTQLFIDQSPNPNNNLNFCNKINELQNKNSIKYLYLPNSMFYENEETFINTEGLIKHTTKLIFKKQTKNNWQLFRKIFKQLKTQTISLNNKNNQFIFINSNKINDFRNFISFHYFATQSLTNLTFYLNLKTEPFILTGKSLKFKLNYSKIIQTKIKYWLDDFFSGGKDEYSQNSLILTNCSKILRSESTNFF